MNRTGSKPGRRISRPITRFKCRWVPNRSRARVYTRRDAARIVCSVLRGHQAQLRQVVTDAQARDISVAPVTLGQIVAEVRSICPEAAKPTEFEVGSAAVAEASAIVSALEENNQILEQVLKTLAIMNAAIAGLLFASNFAAPLRLIVRPVAIGVQSAIRGAQVTVITRKAANDAIIDQFKNIREIQTRLAA